MKGNAPTSKEGLGNLHGEIGGISDKDEDGDGES